MKKILLTLLIISATFSISCTKSNNNNDDDDHISISQVPSSVINAFNTRYPTTSGQDWEREHGTEYKVKFYIGSQRWEARFDANGGFISEEKK